MKKKKLLKDLNEIYENLENLQSEYFKTAAKQLEKITDNFGDLIQGIEDGDYEDEEEKDEKEEE